MPHRFAIPRALRFRRLKFFVAAGAVQVAHAVESSSVEERLNRLEERVRVLSEENAALRQQLSGKPGAIPSRVVPSGSETRLAIGGFLQAQAEFGGAPDSRFSGIKDRFYFRRARIYVAGSFALPFDFKAEIDLGANSLAPASAARAQANEIFLNWHQFDFANVRFGQIKPAFGAEQLASDQKLFTVERSLMNDRLTDSRQVAIGVAGEFFSKRFSYLAVIGNGTGSNTNANDNSKFQRSLHVSGVPYVGTLGGVKTKVSVGAGVLWSEDAALAKSGYNFDSVAGGAVDQVFVGQRRMEGVDAQWNLGAFDLTGEWLAGRFHPVNRWPAPTVDGRGWQVTAAYFVLPGKLQAVVRRDEFDPNRELAGDATTEWLYGLNYLIQGDDL
jgi:hypothetical protein